MGIDDFVFDTLRQGTLNKGSRALELAEKYENASAFGAAARCYSIAIEMFVKGDPGMGKYVPNLVTYSGKAERGFERCRAKADARGEKHEYAFSRSFSEISSNPQYFLQWYITCQKEEIAWKPPTRAKIKADKKEQKERQRRHEKRETQRTLESEARDRQLASISWFADRWKKLLEAACKADTDENALADAVALWKAPANKKHLKEEWAEFGRKKLAGLTEDSVRAPDQKTLLRIAYTAEEWGIASSIYLVVIACVLYPVCLGMFHGIGWLLPEPGTYGWLGWLLAIIPTLIVLVLGIACFLLKYLTIPLVIIALAVLIAHDLPRYRAYIKAAALEDISKIPKHYLFSADGGIDIGVSKHKKDAD